MIEVRIAAYDGHMNIEVKDNGAGMTEEEVSRLLSYENERENQVSASD